MIDYQQMIEEFSIKTADQKSNIIRGRRFKKGEDLDLKGKTLVSCENTGATIRNATWEDGLWRDGTWEMGTWESGKWVDGTWVKGTWKDGLWDTGSWRNGTWENGTWMDGRWGNGIWENGTWKDGIWHNGIWHNGTWFRGTWFRGTWKNGIWGGGKWEGGNWLGGTEKKITKKLKLRYENVPVYSYIGEEKTKEFLEVFDKAIKIFEGKGISKKILSNIKRLSIFDSGGKEFDDRFDSKPSSPQPRKKDRAPQPDGYNKPSRGTLISGVWDGQVLALWEGSMLGGEDKRKVRSKKQLLQVIVHECAHIIYNRMMDKTDRREWRSAWFKTITKKEFAEILKDNSLSSNIGDLKDYNDNHDLTSNYIFSILSTYDETEKDKVKAVVEKLSSMGITEKGELKENSELDKLKRPTEYAKTNPVEDFAETFAAFMLDPGKLSSIAYRRMNNVLRMAAGKPESKFDLADNIYGDKNDFHSSKGMHGDPADQISRHVFARLVRKLLRL